MDGAGGVPMQLTLTINGQPVVAEVLERSGARLRLRLGEAEYCFTASRDALGRVQLDREEAPGVWRRVQGAVWKQKGVSHVLLGGHDFTVAEAGSAGSAEAASPLSPRAPMPGLVRQVLVKAGERVTAGQALAVIEAMKLQLTLSAGGDGVVEAVLAKVGDMVPEGAELVRVKEGK